MLPPPTIFSITIIMTNIYTKYFLKVGLQLHTYRPFIVSYFGRREKNEISKHPPCRKSNVIYVLSLYHFLNDYYWDQHILKVGLQPQTHLSPCFILFWKDSQMLVQTSNVIYTLPFSQLLVLGPVYIFLNEYN